MRTVNGRRTVGVITIGQSPRPDIVPEMLDVLGPGVELLEGGALDGLSGAEIAAIAPRDGDQVLVTRLRDGSSVLIAERHILPCLQAQVDRLTADGAEMVALLCTGEFPPFRSSRQVVYPQQVLGHFVAGVAQGRRLGVVMPVPEQIERGTRRWQNVGAAVCVQAGSPYADMDGLERAVRSLADWRAELIVLDCMGFTQAHKAHAACLSGVPVVLPRTVLARTVAELL